MNRTPTSWTGLALVVSLSALGCSGGDTGDDAAAGGAGAPAPSEAGPVTVAGGFNGPMGVAVASDGTLWVVDSGTGGDDQIMFPDPETGQLAPMPFGETARLVRVAPDGSQTEVAMLPSMALGQEMIGAGHITLMDGTLYITSGGWAEGPDEQRPNMGMVLRLDGGTLTEVANPWPLERDENPAGALVETHPYGLEPGPDGMLWLADAAGNTLYRIDPSSGAMELVAVFDALPSPIPNAARGGAMETEPVPTAVAIAGGETYVSFLPGVPFLPGSAKVVRVSANGEVSDYATGLTMLTDLQTGPDGNLYAVSMGEFTEQGPVPGTGAIVRVAAGSASSPVLTGLSFPTALAFAPNGDAYVTLNGAGPPGAGEVVRYPGLAAGR